MLKKGQKSFEYVILLGIISIAALPVYLYTIDTADDSFRKSNIEDALGSIALAANDLVELGPGNRRELKVQIPRGVEDSEIEDGQLIYTLNGVEFSKSVSMNIEGELPTRAGLHSVRLMSVSDGSVIIGDFLRIYDFAPECIVFPPGPEGSYLDIIGIGFEDGADVYINEELLPSQYIKSIEFELVVVELTTGIFSGNAHGKEYDTIIENPGGARSNEETFEIYSNQNHCGR